MKIKSLIFKFKIFSISSELTWILIHKTFNRFIFLLDIQI